MTRPIRVLHAPWNVAAQAATLARFERECGLDSRAVVLRDRGGGFPPDEALSPANGGGLALEVARFRLLARALRWADVVHLNFGQSVLTPEPSPDVAGGLRASWKRGLWQTYARLLWFNDLPLLKASGRPIVMTWQGDDARQGDVSRQKFEISIASHAGEGYYDARTDAWKRRAIAKIGRYANRLYALNPDLLHVLPPGTAFLPYANMDVTRIEARPPGVPEVPVVVHAPTHRGAKGTAYLLAAVDRLRQEGIPFRLDLVEGVDRAEALRRYADADIAVDQLLAGWYGGFAVEMMTLGKPVICYLREGDLHFLPPRMREELPLIQATPDGIYEALKGILTTRKAELPALGQASRRFAETWHDPRRIARDLAEVYAGLLDERKPRRS